MEILSLNPLPATERSRTPSYRQTGDCGFVDEKVVLGVIARGAYLRTLPDRSIEGLFRNEDDFAGMILPVDSPFREIARGEAGVEAPLRTPSPPAPLRSLHSSEPGLDEPYQGAPRWWMFGLSGALTCGVLSLMVLNLAQRETLREIAAGYIPSQHPAVTAGAEPVQAPEAPALTAAESRRR